MYFCNYLLEKYILLSNNYIVYNFINKIRNMEHICSIDLRFKCNYKKLRGDKNV